MGIGSISSIKTAHFPIVNSSKASITAGKENYGSELSRSSKRLLSLGQWSVYPEKADRTKSNVKSTSNAENVENYGDDWESEMDETSKSMVKFFPSNPEAFRSDVCIQRQAAIDNLSYRTAIDHCQAKSLDDVCKCIADLSAGKHVIDRAWIIFYWISQNIEYDVDAYFHRNVRHQSANDVFTNRKGVCDAFGTIFESLCTRLGLECKKISGYAKGFDFQPGQKTLARANHAWNAIRLDGAWYLVDSTWGAGYLDREHRNQKRLEPFYFLVRPEHMVYRHFPEQSRWQLLASPISMKEFLALPYVYPCYFELGLRLVNPSDSSMVSFDSHRGFGEILFDASPNTSFSSKLEQQGTTDNEVRSLVQYDANRKLWQCLVAPSKGGRHTLTIFAHRIENTSGKETNKITYYECAMQLVLQVPNDYVGSRTLPSTYPIFTEKKCQIFEPLDAKLEPSTTITLHCRIPGASQARVLLDGVWISPDTVKNGLLKRQIIVPNREIVVYAQFANKRGTGNYDGLFKYTLK